MSHGCEQAQNEIELMDFTRNMRSEITDLLAEKSKRQRLVDSGEVSRIKTDLLCLSDSRVFGAMDCRRITTIASEAHRLIIMLTNDLEKESEADNEKSDL